MPGARHIGQDVEGIDQDKGIPGRLHRSLCRTGEGSAGHSGAGSHKRYAAFDDAGVEGPSDRREYASLGQTTGGTGSPSHRRPGRTRKYHERPVGAGQVPAGQPGEHSGNECQPPAAAETGLRSKRCD